jgi:tetratricopeptide (TPR) repeat protein
VFAAVVGPSASRAAYFCVARFAGATQMGSRNLRFLAGAVLGLLANVAAVSFGFAQQAAAQGGVIKLNQGWSDDDRLQYYNAPQGSAAVPYDLYLNLEAADSADLFRSDKIAESYGMIPQPPNAKYNPDGLPVGIDHTKVASGQFKGEWAGITCAACHNGQLHYKGMKIQIDGGVNTGFDFSRFAQGLGDALAATAASPEKFDRLAARLNAGDATAKAELRTRLEKTSATLHYFNTISMAAPSPAGPARIDAVGEVHNYMIAAMGTPENWLPSLAPAKFPFVWSAPQSSWVQLEDVLAARRDIAETEPDIQNLVPLAALLANLGEYDEADRIYVEAIGGYRNVSPFPLAWACFQLGVLWGETTPERDHDRAAQWYRRAIDYLPMYVRARVHLAEIHIDCEELATAESLLMPAKASGDPEVNWRLAEVFAAQARPYEADRQREAARSAFETLLNRHELAFADHAAEFYLNAGANSKRAWELARINLANRPTLRAFELAHAAVSTVGNARLVSELAVRARARWGHIKAFAHSPLASIRSDSELTTSGASHD